MNKLGTGEECLQNDLKKLHNRNYKGSDEQVRNWRRMPAEKFFFKITQQKQVKQVLEQEK